MIARPLTLAAVALAVAAVAAPAYGAWVSNGSATGSTSATMLGKPTVTLASKTHDTVRIEWNTPAGAPPNSYIVKRGTTTLPGCLQNSCVDSGLAGSTTYTYTVQATLANWLGAVSDGLQVTTDAAPPSTPDLTQASDSGSSSSDNITKVSTPTVTGTAPSNSTVKIYRGPSVVGTQTLSGGATTYSITTSSLADGTHELTATATVSATESARSSVLSVTVDTVAPRSAPTLTVGTVTATSAAFSGTAAENGGTVTVTATAQNGNPGTATGTPSGGSWSGTASGLTDQKRYTATAVHADVAGNTSAASSSVTFSTPKA